MGKRKIRLKENTKWLVGALIAITIPVLIWWLSLDRPLIDKSDEVKVNLFESICEGYKQVTEFKYTEQGELSKVIEHSPESVRIDCLNSSFLRVKLILKNYGAKTAFLNASLNGWDGIAKPYKSENDTLPPNETSFLEWNLELHPDIKTNSQLCESMERLSITVFYDKNKGGDKYYSIFKPVFLDNPSLDSELDGFSPVTCLDGEKILDWDLVDQN